MSFRHWSPLSKATAICLIATPILVVTSYWMPILSLVLNISIMVPGIMMLIFNRPWLVVLICWRSKTMVPVELIDRDGDQYHTIAIVDDHQRMVAPVYWSTNTGSVLLNEDGTADPSSQSSYIKWWKPLRMEERALHALRFDSVDTKTIKAEDVPRMQKVRR